MSLFKEQFQAYHSGKASFESAEVIPPPSDVITDEFVIQTREEREEIGAAIASDVAMADDDQSLDEATGAINNVATAINLTKDITPTQTDALVDLANESFKHSSMLLGVNVPRLKVARDGTIDEESLEAFGSWFTSIGSALVGSVGKMFGRIGLNWQQKKTSLKSLNQRAARLQSKLSGRKGVGGKPIKLSNNYRVLLVKGNGYTTNLVQDTQAVIAVIGELFDILLEYDKRVNEFVKTRAFEAIGNGNLLSFTSQLVLTDLIKQLDGIAESGQLFLGNVVLKNDKPNTPVTGYRFVAGEPKADVLVKHLDPPMSMTNEEVVTTLNHLVPAINHQLVTFDAAAAAMDKSHRNLMGLLQRLNSDSTGSGDDEEWFDDLGDAANTSELVRLEYQVSQISGGIMVRLNNYASHLLGQLNAALVMTEESVFQD